MHLNPLHPVSSQLALGHSAPLVGIYLDGNPIGLEHNLELRVGGANWGWQVLVVVGILLCRGHVSELTNAKSSPPRNVLSSASKFQEFHQTVAHKIVCTWAQHQNNPLVFE